ncbi:MAG: Do family serine endopeptidase, partial [Aestuariivirga sp.]
ASPAYADIAGLDATKSLNPLVEKVMPAVVSVEVKLSDKAVADAGVEQGQQDGQMPPDLKNFFDQFPGFKFRAPPQHNGGGRALGSGFVLTSDGYVVTNNHVVKDADNVKLTFQDGTSYDAKVIGTDQKTDLALLKINSTKTFPHVDFAKTEAKVGDTVMAVGNPFGLGGTVTRGIISARGRDIGSGPYDDFLQIDASINKGNSGGPTFNLDGEVVGINTAIYSPSGGSVGIGFAIPAATAENVIDLLKSGDHKVTRGWLGVQIQPVSADIAESLGLSGTKGALVADFASKSPALKAGIKSGDVIVKVDDAAVDSDRDLAKIIGGIAPGKEVKIAVIRDGKPETVSVTLGTLPVENVAMNAAPDAAPAVNEGHALAGLGLQVVPAADGKGVKVIKIDPKSDAADIGIKEGDVILKIQDQDVTDQASVESALKKATGKKVLLLVKTADGQSFVTLQKSNG